MGGAIGEDGAETEIVLPALEGLSEYPGVPGGVAERSGGGPNFRCGVGGRECC
jgi:hypothetical protein